jgi:hypothetical protein
MTARKRLVDAERTSADGKGAPHLVSLDDHDESRTSLADAHRAVSHLDADGHRWVAATARLTPEQIEAIAQRLAALFLRAG